MSSAEASEFASCAVCARTILRGERVADYVAPDGEPVAVCSLCKPRAEASGWTPAARAGGATEPTSARRRRSVKLRERIARVSDAASARLSRRAGDRAEAAPSGVRPAAAGERAAGTGLPKAGPPSPEQATRRAVEAFNRSPAARTVRGLRRSLGEPQATVRADGPGAVLVTVAWELSWYQWRIEGAEVSEVGKGKEVAELAGPDRDWNAEVAGDGSLRLSSQTRRERVRG